MTYLLLFPRIQAKTPKVIIWAYPRQLNWTAKTLDIHFLVETEEFDSAPSITKSFMLEVIRRLEAQPITSKLRPMARATHFLLAPSWFSSLNLGDF